MFKKLGTNIKGIFSRKGVVDSSISGITYGANSPLSGRFGSEVKGGYSKLAGSTLGGRSFITGLREFMAFLTVLFSIFFLKKEVRRAIKPFSKLKTSKAARILAFSALLGGPVAALSRYVSIDMIGSGPAGVFTGLWTIFLVVFGKLILKRQYHKLTWIGVAVMVGGGLFAGYGAFLQFKGFQPEWIIGICLALITGLAWGLQHALVERAMAGVKNDVSAVEANIYRYGISSLVFFIVLIPMTFAIDDLNIGEALKTLGGISLLWLFLLGADAGIANILYFKGISKLGAVWSTVFYNLYVPFGLLWALIINQEVSGWESWVSAIIIFIGMGITNYGSSKEKRAKGDSPKIIETNNVPSKIANPSSDKPK